MPSKYKWTHFIYFFSVKNVLCFQWLHYKKSSERLKRLFDAPRSWWFFAQIIAEEETKTKVNSNLQCTTSLHLSSIALSGMNGFSERHVKYFPSSSTTGMNVRTLNDWLPVSENCGNGWKMIWKLASDNRIFSRHQIVSSHCTEKLSCYRWKFMKHSNQGRWRKVLHLRFQMNRRKLNSSHASLSAWKYENCLPLKP